VQVDRFVDLDVLEVCEVPKPVPPDGGVLARSRRRRIGHPDLRN
jgi:hypothetical protein